MHHWALAAILAFAMFSQSSPAQVLGSADQFAVLAGTTVTSTGNTVLNGDLGVSPGTAITGFLPGVVNGTTYSAGSVALQAQSDALAGYIFFKTELSFQDLTGIDLGGLTLDAGVRNFDTSAQLTGIVILDAQGNPDAQFDFQIGSTLTTAAGSEVVLVNGAQADNVHWAVGSSATLGTTTVFFGDIVTDQSITLNTGANVTGSLVALNGAVTLNDNTVTSEKIIAAAVPEPAIGWLLFASALFIGLRRWLAGAAAGAIAAVRSAPARPPDLQFTPAPLTVLVAK